jgi:hypothetical protein
VSVGHDLVRSRRRLRCVFEDNPRAERRVGICRQPQVMKRPLPTVPLAIRCPPALLIPPAAWRWIVMHCRRCPSQPGLTSSTGFPPARWRRAGRCRRPVCAYNGSHADHRRIAFALHATGRHADDTSSIAAFRRDRSRAPARSAGQRAGNVVAHPSDWRCRRQGRRADDPFTAVDGSVEYRDLPATTDARRSSTTEHLVAARRRIGRLQMPIGRQYQGR